MRRTLIVGSWVVGLCGAAVVLVLAGRGALAGPDLAHPATWSAWARGRDPVDAAVAVLRTGVLVVTLYLLVVTLLGLVARLAALPRLVAGLDVAGGPLVRRVLTGAAGAGVALSSFAPAMASAQTASPPPTAVMRLVDGPTTTTAPPTFTTAPSTTVAAAAPGPSAAALPAGDSTVAVAPGDSFWTIAEHHVARELGRTPTDREVARYWRALVAANRDRLAVPGQPDLIFPGQRFRLPS